MGERGDQATLPENKELFSNKFCNLLFSEELQSFRQYGAVLTAPYEFFLLAFVTPNYDARGDLVFFEEIPELPANLPALVDDDE